MQLMRYLDNTILSKIQIMELNFHIVNFNYYNNFPTQHTLSHGCPTNCHLMSWDIAITIRYLGSPTNGSPTDN